MSLCLYQSCVCVCVFAEPPDNVSISFVNHTGPLLEGHQYILQCRVQDVAPVQNLTVTFYRGDSVLGPVQSSSTSVETPVTETFTASFYPSREDDGLQYWCEAKLNLGAQGPALPPVMRSQKLHAIRVSAKAMFVCVRELLLGMQGLGYLTQYLKTINTFDC